MLYQEQCPRADHFPIISTIAVMIAWAKEELRWNFKEVDWKEFEEELGQQLDTVLRTRIQTKEEMEGRLDDVMGVLERMIEAKV